MNTKFSKPINIYDLFFKCLPGFWKIKRKIRGQYFAQKRDDEGLGTAKFILMTDHKMFYREDLKINNNQEAYREYQYRYDSEFNKVYVDFIDHQTQGLFHEIQQNNTSPYNFVGHHACGEDHYEILYKFNFSNNQLTGFNLEYRVTGPEKNYTIESNCTES